MRSYTHYEAENGRAVLQADRVKNGGTIKDSSILSSKVIVSEKK
jgi:hypothetical protein